MYCSASFPDRVSLHNLYTTEYKTDESATPPWKAWSWRSDTKHKCSPWKVGKTEPRKIQETGKPTKAETDFHVWHMVCGHPMSVINGCEAVQQCCSKYSLGISLFLIAIPMVTARGTLAAVLGRMTLPTLAAFDWSMGEHMTQTGPMRQQECNYGTKSVLALFLRGRDINLGAVGGSTNWKAGKVVL